MALDNFRRIDMKINRANDYQIETQFAKEGDYNGRELVVQITDAGEVSNQNGVSLNLGWHHNSAGNSGLDPFSVVDAPKGIFKITYPTEMLIAGDVTASIQVFEGEKITLTRNFKITVEKNPISEDAIVSENSFSVLQEALKTVNRYDGRITGIEDRTDWLTPKDFNAVGDGVTDDTQALREAVYASHNTGKVLFFPAGEKYMITDALNYYNGEYYDITLNMVGSLPSAKGEYALSKYGGIKLNASTAIFKNTRIYGSIRNLSFVGKRDETYHFFENCSLYNVVITQNNISNFGAFMYDTDANMVTRISENQFLTVFYFQRQDSSSAALTDSFITGNYINGGAEPTDNACFEFNHYNGSVIQGNFIDYYHTIYRYKSNVLYQGPTSIGNQYQVFLYFYTLGKAGGGSLLSSGDTFNWNDKSKLAHLLKYKEYTYVGADGITYDIPTYIYQPKQNFQISIRDAYIQSNVDNIVWVSQSLSIARNSSAEANFIGVNKYRQGKISYKKGENLPFYNAGENPLLKIEPYFVVEVTELPDIRTGWSAYPNGARILFNNQEYRAISKYDATTSSWKISWVEVD